MLIKDLRNIKIESIRKGYGEALGACPITKILKL